MTRPVVLAVLALLLTVGQASAECAWVLWSFSYCDKECDWRESIVPSAAFQKKAECDETAKKNTHGDKAADKVLKDANEWAQQAMPGFVPPALGTTRVWRCLPDTIDPRGPKGGR